MEPNEELDGMTYYPPVDPGDGLQKASTASSALGFGALVGSGAGNNVADALLGTHAPQVLTAGFSLAGLGHLDLFAAGLMLVGVGIILNVLSMTTRYQHRKEFMARVARERRRKNPSVLDGPR